MHAVDQHPINRSSRRRTQRAGAIAAAVLVACGLLAASTAPATAGGLLEEPCFATCGQYRWFLRKSEEVRDNAACCLPLIRKAKLKEEHALELYEAARDPSNTSAETSDLVREANRQIEARGRLIRKFIDCVNGVTRALGMAGRGLDPTVEYATACGVVGSCELDAGIGE